MCTRCGKTDFDNATDFVQHLVRCKHVWQQETETVPEDGHLWYRMSDKWHVADPMDPDKSACGNVCNLSKLNASEPIDSEPGRDFCVACLAALPDAAAALTSSE